MTGSGAAPGLTQADQQRIAQFQQQALGLMMSGNTFALLQAVQALAAQLSPVGQQLLAWQLQQQGGAAAGPRPGLQPMPAVIRSGNTVIGGGVAVGPTGVTLLR